MQKTQQQAPENTEGYTQDADGNWIPDYDCTLVDFEEGDIVSGEIVRIDRDEVLVDIGYKSEGVIPQNELAVKNSVNPFDVVQVGDKIDSLVLQKEDADGRLILSRKRAEYEKSWRDIEDRSKTGELINGEVIEVVKGGLIIDIGLRGFLPASLVDIRRVRDLKDFIGRRVECKIIEMNRNRNNVVLSRRAVIEEEQKEQREQILDNLTVSKVVKGSVSSIVPFGAFVDLEGIDGLIHISELSWDHVEHPSEVLQVGDEIEVKVLDVDRERQRVSLGYKQLFENPWMAVIEKWPADSVADGTVVKITTYGAFVSLDNENEGLVHISEISEEQIEKPDDVLSVGQSVSVRIIGHDSDKRRINLSIKRASSDAVETEKPKKVSAKKVTENVETVKIEVTEETIEVAETVVETEPAPEVEAEPESVEVKVVEVDNEESKQEKTVDDGSLESVIAALKKDHGAKTK